MLQVTNKIYSKDKYKKVILCTGHPHLRYSFMDQRINQRDPSVTDNNHGYCKPQPLTLICFISDFILCLARTIFYVHSVQGDHMCSCFVISFL